MLPAGFTASAPLSGHVVSPASSPQTVPSRSGRLRGLSYLRHYTANHHHHSSHASPPAAATVVTAQAVPAVPPAVPSPLPDSTSPLTRRATSPLNNTGTAWIPTVSGVSGLSRVASSPAAELSTSSVHATSVSPGTTHRTVRSIDETILSSDRAARSSAPAHSPSSAALMAQTSDQPAASIRFTPFIDTRATRESLHFSPIERVLRYPEERIRVGRYSVRDEQNPSAPVGFKSKVVSRRHCEFWCESGQWFVRDVKSSSGTFLNHIRLSGAGMESSRYALNDGDILQLGMDFKGGEEQIFRCVRIRVELNRAWQKGLNNFNMSAHRRLRNLAKGKDTDSCSTNSSECAICLLKVAPCQALFVAPCSHVWHYKCVKPLLDKEFPAFLCPNCRAIADLDRDIEEDEFEEEVWEQIPDEVLHGDDDNGGGTLSPNSTILREIAEADKDQRRPAQDLVPPQLAAPTAPEPGLDPVPSFASSRVGMEGSPPPPAAASPTAGLDTTVIRRRTGGLRELDLAPEAANHHRHHHHHHHHNNNNNGHRKSGGSDTGSGSSDGGVGHDGPMTPMNDAGPFLLDGRGGVPRSSQPVLHLDDSSDEHTDL